MIRTLLRWSGDNHMAKFNCKCGKTISNTTYPSTHEARLVTDLDVDDAPDESDVVGRSRDVIECPSCWCLWIETASRSHIYVRFVPDGEPLKLSEQQGGYRG